MINKKDIIWITGASSGIGYSLTSKLLANGNTVIATARNVAVLEDLKIRFKSNLFYYSLDVTNSIAVKNFCTQLLEEFNKIDIMILCAGICEYVEWPDLNLEAMHNNMNVNYWGVVNCISHGVSILNKEGNPYIVGISSASHIVGLPRAEGYGASKAALHYLLETLQIELNGTNIDLSIVTPGFVKTRLTYKNDFYMPQLISVDKATNIILRGMHKRKLEIKFPIFLILILNILYIMPSKFRIYLLSKIKRSV